MREVLFMKCPKCGYTSFPYLESCRQCGHRLAEQRAALGIYALRPDPPDLLLAYQAANIDVTGATLMQPLSVPGSDLGQLDEIALELAEAEPVGSGTHEVEEHAGAAPDLVPTLDLESTGAGELPPVEPSAKQVSSHEAVMPQPLDLRELGDITFEPENAADLRGKSPESAQTPRQSPEVKPVYDLDQDDDLDGVTLGSAVDNDDEEIVEYTLEIEDDLELEVDELALEEDDEAEEDDDDDR
jgi:hypothetical protein